MNTSQSLAQNADALDVKVTSKTCQCGNFFDVETGASTGCLAETNRDFAPGHDAKLKSFLIRVGAQGHSVRVLGLPGTLNAEQAANVYGFGYMVAEGIKRAEAREFAKLIRETKRQAKASHQTPREVTCKVGRWTYEGVITDSPVEGPQFTYTNRRGVQTTTTKFTKIA